MDKKVSECESKVEIKNKEIKKLQSSMDFLKKEMEVLYAKNN
jgi:hypothetical protein